MPANEDMQAIGISRLHIWWTQLTTPSAPQRGRTTPAVSRPSSSWVSRWVSAAQALWAAATQKAATIRCLSGGATDDPKGSKRMAGLAASYACCTDVTVNRGLLSTT